MFEHPTRIITVFLLHGHDKEVPTELQQDDVIAIGVIDYHNAPDGQYINNPHARADDWRKAGNYSFSRNLMIGGEYTILHIATTVPNLELDSRWELWVAKAIDVAYFTYFQSTLEG